MSDIFDAKKRSDVMSKIRSQDTKPERLVRSMLHNMGYRFRLNRKELPGKPDIVLPKYRSVVFVHGCFWHQHKSCREGRIPASREAYWRPKLMRTIDRDKINQRKLRKSGWSVLVIWECQIERTPELVERKLLRHLSAKR